MIKLFAIGFILLFLLSIQFRFIAKANYFRIFIFAIIISITNALFVREIVWGNAGDIIFYAFGAATGSVIGTFTEKNLLAKINNQKRRD